MTLNLAVLFEAVSAAVPERPAVTCGDRTLSYAELDRRATAVAQHLVSAGVEPGQHVGVYLLNGTEYVEALLGCFKARAVPVNINYRYTEHELEHLFTDADLVGLVVGGEFARYAAAVAARTPLLRSVLVVGDGSEPVEWPETVDAVDYEQALAAQPEGPTARAAELSADDRFVLYTGGTTGLPKGVVWRHEDFYFAALSGGNPYGDPHLTPEALAAAAAAGGPMTFLVPIPLMHGAASYTLLTGLFGGSHMVLMRTFDAVGMLRAIQDHGCQIASVVGDAIVRPFVEALRAHKDDYDLSSLFLVGSGGAILSSAVQAELAEQLPHVMIRNSFGASESGVDGQIDLGPDGLMRLTPTPSVRVVDAAMQDVKPGSGVVGSVAHSGHVPLAYHNDPEKTARTFPVIDGVRWAVLGDAAMVEEDGTIVVLGRGSGCINTGGEKVFPEEVEQVLKAHPAVMDALVAGVPDERFGHRVGAVVELRPGHDGLDVDELRAHVRQELAGYKVPATVRVVDHVVRSPTGKADYRWAARTLEDSRA